MTLPIVLRPMAPGDEAFVLSSWLRSYASSDDAKRVTAKPEWEAGHASRTYWSGQHRLAETLVKRAPPLIAAWQEDPDVIAGWLCAEPGCVHYLYVKDRFRRMGVARALLATLGEGPVMYSHRSRACAELPLPAGWRWDPYAALAAGGGEG